MLVAGSHPDGSPPPEEEGASLPADPDLSAPEEPASKTDLTTLSLEDRVRRLEDVIAGLQLASPDWIETTRAGRPPKERPSTSITSAPVSTLASNIEADAPTPPPPILTRQHPWLLADIYIELRCIPRLFFDPRYHLSWQTLLLTPLLILALVLVKWVVGSIFLIGYIELILSPILFYVLFKVLSREATRYRQTSPDLPLAWRL